MSKLDTVRAFIAVNLSIKATQAVAETQKNLRAEISSLPMKISWVPAANMHVTIKFLGGIDRELGEGVLSSLKKAASEIDSFTVKVGRAGAFPSVDRPRILWVGLEDPDVKLTELYEMVESSLQELGFKREKRSFHPHITIGRVRYGKEDIGSILDGLSREIDEDSRIAGLTLYESRLHRRGAEYKVIGRAFLRDMILDGNGRDNNEAG